MKPSDLKQGDVLFYNSNGFVSRAIRFFDHGTHNHTAFWTGESVAEAIAEGFVDRSLNDSINVDVNFVDIYRPFVKVSGVVRELTQEERVKLVHTCDEYLKDGDRYAYEALIMLAVICELRQHLNMNDSSRTWLDKIMNFAMKRLVNYAKSIDILNLIIKNDKEPLICSESVYRIFNDSTLRLNLLPESLHNVYRDGVSSSVVGAKLRDYQLLKEVDPNFVTPHDLAMSSETKDDGVFLRFIGRLDFKHLSTDY